MRVRGGMRILFVNKISNEGILTNYIFCKLREDGVFKISAIYPLSAVHVALHWRNFNTSFVHFPSLCIEE